MRTKTQTATQRRKRAAPTTSADGPDPLLASIGSRIRDAREKADVAQETCAAEIPLSRAHFGLIERGYADVRIGTLARIAATLDTPLEDLVPSLAEIKKLVGRK